MMTKVKAKVVNENISKDGKTIQVEYVTDDLSINQLLDLPIIWSERFPINTRPGQMKQAFIIDITSIINSAKKAIDDNALIGREFTVNV